MRLADAVAIVFTVASAGALLCAYLARWVDPNRAWILAFAGMGAPILYLANLILGLYWVVRWRQWAFIPALVLSIGIGWVPLFFKPALGRHSAEPTKAIRVMTWNVAGMVNNGAESTIDSITALIRRWEPDILCLQEFQSTTAAQKRVIDSLIGLPYNEHSYSRPNTSGGGLGVAVYSRWRIIDHGEILFPQTSNSAMWSDIALSGDTLRVFCCHLQSTSVNRDDVEYVEDFIAEESPVRTRKIASKLRHNFGIRAAQADTLSTLIRAWRGSVVVCGDFNDTPMSYAYTRIRGSLKDAFVEAGSGTSNTYEGLFSLFRIDYVLHSRTLKTLSYTAPATVHSDHKPVIVGLRVR